MNTMADGEREKFEAWCGDRYDLATKKDTFGERQYKDRWVQGAFVGWKASIAARQPVGEPVDYIEFLDSQNDSLRRAIHAIMAKLVFLLDEDQFADVDAIALAAGVSPPAQAGDLGRFREAVAYAARSADFATHTAIGDKLRELLALIDGKA